jgi:hypothetical protein
MNLDKLFELNPQAIVWDGLDGAIVGMATKEANGPIIVTYVEEGEFLTYEVKNETDEPLDRWGRIEFGPIVAYDTDKIIEILMEDMKEVDSLESDRYLDAIEHFDYNIDGAYVGEFTPLHIPMYEGEE